MIHSTEHATAGRCGCVSTQGQRCERPRGHRGNHEVTNPGRPVSRTVGNDTADVLDRAAMLFVDEARELTESALAASDDAVEQWQGLADQCTADAQMCGDLARIYRARQSTRTGA